jgi:hypothetical protein
MAWPCRDHRDSYKAAPIKDAAGALTVAPDPPHTCSVRSSRNSKQYKL